MNGEDPGNLGLRAFRKAVAGDEAIGVRQAALCAHALLGHPRLAVRETDAVDRVLVDLRAADTDAQCAEAIHPCRSRIFFSQTEMA